MALDLISGSHVRLHELISPRCWTRSVYIIITAALCGVEWNLPDNLTTKSFTGNSPPLAAYDNSSEDKGAKKKSFIPSWSKKSQPVQEVPSKSTSKDPVLDFFSDEPTALSVTAAASDPATGVKHHLSGGLLEGMS